VIFGLLIASFSETNFQYCDSPSEIYLLNAFIKRVDFVFASDGDENGKIVTSVVPIAQSTLVLLFILKCRAQLEFIPRPT